MVDIVNADTGQLQHPRTADSDCRRSMQFVAFSDAVGVVRVGAGVREDPPVTRNLQILGLLRRTQNQGGALVHHVVGVHQLRVRPADHPVVRPGSPDLLSSTRLAAPGMRIALCNCTELCPQLTDPATVIVHRLAVGDPERLLEQGVNE